MRKLLVLAVLISIAVVALRLRAPAIEPTDSRLAQDRLWVDHLPKSERDTFEVFTVLTQKPVGVFETLTVWRGSYEVFRYELSGEDMRVVFPHTGDREKVRVRARRCNERGMDFCLELDGASRGVKRYYSREGWEINRIDDIEGFAAKLANETK
jgi:hypothetical protein